MIQLNVERRFITVYNKDFVKIAIFDNQTNSTDAKIQQSLMVSPIVELVSNESSTLSFQIVATSEKWQQIKDPENIYECNGRYYTALNENSIVYDGLIVNVTLVETWYLLDRVFLQAHNIDTKIEAMDEHTVKILPRSSPSHKLTVNGTVYDDSEVKDSRGVVMPRGSAGYALWAILKGTDWGLGICDVLPDGFSVQDDYGTFNVESDMKSALENIQFIQELYGGILVWDSKNKTCSLRDERKEGTDFNTWKGYEIRKGKNLSSHAVITWDNRIITKLYPLGNGNLNIKRVNGGKGYVENHSYTNAVYEAYEQQPNIYDTNDEGGQKTLKFWAEQKLEKLCKPRKSIKYDILDLRATPGFEHEIFDINDIVKAYYVDDKTGKEMNELVRIQRIKYNYFFPSVESEIDVGDKVANEQEIFHQIYKTTTSSVPTDQNGHISGDDIWIDLPEDWYCDVEGNQTGSSTSSLNSSFEKIVEKHTENSDAIAGLRIYADETYATVDSFTSFEQRTNETLQQSNTRITQVSDALQAQIRLEADHYSQTNQGISSANASISVVASNLQSEISARTRFESNINGEVSRAFTQISQVSNKAQSAIDITAGFNSKVASIQLQASENSSSIRLKADKTYVDNLVAKKVSTNELDSKVATLGFTKITTAEVKRLITSTVDSAYINGKVTTSRDIKANYIELTGSVNTYGLAVTSWFSFLGKSVRWTKVGSLYYLTN